MQIRWTYYARLYGVIALSGTCKTWNSRLEDLISKCEFRTRLRNEVRMLCSVCSVFMKHLDMLQESVP
jgi:hypothetical protein